MNTAGFLDRLIGECDGLTFVDIGARWGVNPRWRAAAEKATMICFEPDAEECVRLNASAAANVRYLPYGLAEKPGPQQLYVTREPACSSVHKPIEALYRHYPPLAIIEPVATIEIDCRTFDSVARDESIGSVAVMKLDTQGSEHAILRGSPEALSACSLVDVEVEFNPLYERQGLFCDVDRFLRDQGFTLWRFENLVHYAPQLIEGAGPSFLFASDPDNRSIDAPNGQVFWAQVQYVRATYPRTSDAPIQAAEALRAATAAGLYGFWDLALEILRKSSRADLHDLLDGVLRGRSL